MPGAISAKPTSCPNASELSVSQDLCNDVRAYTLRFANQELAPRLRTGCIFARRPARSPSKLGSPCWDRKLSLPYE